ncbi:class I SAM-dependent methyltransferase [Sabulibacter ruber]|uniref:class I SAM-dependent methyltransferase n=1 Tax=Sabulibacter ruber TaxID=2811901 RepID=UPI001A9660EE|nr:class I SAM-dependent methyltransferase [Sabulibacter ruber]
MPSSPTPDFNLIAPVYDALAQAVYGQAQLKAQAHFLPLVPAQSRVLILGGGSGWILPQLLQKSAPAQVLYLEASAKMVHLAKRRLGQSPSNTNVEFRVGTEADLLPQEKFHVVITPFVLDLFSQDQAQNMMQRLSQALLPSSLWLHTDFYLSASPTQRLWQKPLLWSMYKFFGLVSGISGKSLPPFELLFTSLGFQTKQEAFFFRGFIRAQVLQRPDPA